MKKRYFVLFLVRIGNVKIITSYPFSKKHYFFLLFIVSVAVKMKRHLQENNQLRY